MYNKVFKIGSLVLVFSILIGSVISCEKEDNFQQKEEKQIEKKENSQRSSVDYDLNISATAKNGSFNLFLVGAEYTYGEMYGYDVEHLTFSNEMDAEIKQLKYNSESGAYESSENMYIKSLKFYNYQRTSVSAFRVDIQINKGEPTTIYVESDKVSMGDFIQAQQELFSESRINPLIPFFVYVVIKAAVTVADASLEYCQAIIEKGVENCTVNHVCASIGRCSVKCVKCPE